MNIVDYIILGVIGISVLLFVLSLVSYIKATKKLEDSKPIENLGRGRKLTYQ